MYGDKICFKFLFESRGKLATLIYVEFVVVFAPIYSTNSRDNTSF